MRSTRRVVFCAAVLLGPASALGVVHRDSLSAIAPPAVGEDLESSQLVRLSLPGGKLQAVVNPLRGAELAGLEFQRNGQWLQLLYRGMEFAPTEGWTGRALILWPAVGRNFSNPPDTHARQHPEASNALDPTNHLETNNQLGWRLHGKFYPIPIHGFARDFPWRILDRGACEHSDFVRLVLHDNEQTRRSYPFAFELTTEYRVWRDSLYIRQWVRSDQGNTEAMPFSIGNHITLRIPLVPGSDPGATTIATPATEQVITDRSGRPTGQVAAVNYTEPRRLDSLESLTPISLSGYSERPAWARITDPSGFAVTVDHSEAHRPPGVPVLFNLWGDMGQGYFAPEPWVGKQNSLASGDGVIALAPGDSFEWTIAVRLTDGKGAQHKALAKDMPPTCY